MALALADSQSQYSVTPSWAPDLAQWTAESQRKYGFHLDYERWNWAGGSSSFNPEFTIDDLNLLQLQGVEWSIICQICPDPDLSILKPLVMCKNSL